MTVYPSPIFGPVHSRRLGVSLGINLLPADGKVCSFDCLYCECGLNAERRPHLPMPTREEVRTALEARLRDMAAHGPQPDVLTFAGNGEPTAHPDFAGVIDDTIGLRDRFFPKARVSVLSNATFIHREAVFEALKRVDNNILKLDTCNEAYIRMLDRPYAGYDLQRIVERMKAFEGRCIVQTMFLKGTCNGLSVDNTSDIYVRPWLQTVREIAPRQVMVYTIARQTPVGTLQKASPEELNRIAQLLREAGLDVSVAY